MRELVGHRFDELNDALTIKVLESLDEDGVCCYYAISSARCNCGSFLGFGRRHIVRFQRGSVLDAGVNGISVESLLVVVEDHLEVSGTDSDSGSREALLHVREALKALQSKTSA